ncbi:MAG: Sua5/YciO/YrdC/YwlC family protein [Promethearchaeota archaeon]
MGLILKFRPNQLEKWDFFFQHILDLYREGKLLSFPLGRAGYGIGGDPSNLNVYYQYWDLYGEDFFKNVIFIGDSIETLSQLGVLNPLAQKITEHFWPGDLVLHVPFNHQPKNAIQEKIFSLNPELETVLLQRSIYLLVPKHPVIQAFFSYLKKNGHLPVMLGNYALISPNFCAQDAVTVMNELGNEQLGVVADGGRMQKGRRVLPVTRVGVFHLDHIEIEEEGLISKQNLFNTFPDLDDSNSDSAFDSELD